MVAAVAIRGQGQPGAFEGGVVAGGEGSQREFDGGVGADEGCGREGVVDGDGRGVEELRCEGWDVGEVLVRLGRDGWGEAAGWLEGVLWWWW